MFAPYKVSDFQGKIISLYTAAVVCNAGALVDIDPTDTSATTGSVGFTSLSAGSVKLATVAPASNAAGSTNFGRELGVAIPTVSTSGPSLQERILELASSYMTIPVGAALAVFVPSPGDIISTSEFVGFLPADVGATGAITQTGGSATAVGAACGISNGRFRLAQSTDAVRARYIGNTTLNGVLAGLFQFA